MRRILSLPGLTVLSWLASLGLIVLMAAMLAFRAWHPSFLPATIGVGLVGVAGLCSSSEARGGSSSGRIGSGHWHGLWSARCHCGSWPGISSTG